MCVRSMRSVRLHTSPDVPQISRLDTPFPSGVRRFLMNKNLENVAQKTSRNKSRINVLQAKRYTLSVPAKCYVFDLLYTPQAACAMQQHACVYTHTHTHTRTYTHAHTHTHTHTDTLTDTYIHTYIHIYIDEATTTAASLKSCSSSRCLPLIFVTSQWKTLFLALVEENSTKKRKKGEGPTGAAGALGNLIT